MKLPKNVKPEICVSGDPHRQVICQPWTAKVGEETFLYSTDGQKMLKIPVQLEEGEEVGAIPNEAFKMARKESGKRGNASMHCNGLIRFDNGATIPRPDQKDWKLPDCEQVFPAKDRPVKYKIALDAFLLAELQEGAGGSQVMLEFGENTDVIRVTFRHKGCDPVGAVGLLMPCRCF